MRVLVSLFTFGLLSCSTGSPTEGSTGDGFPTDVEYEGDDAGECSDGADNDKDGFFDCDDNEWMNSPDCLGGTTNTNTNGGGNSGGGNTGTTGTTGTTVTDCEGPLCDFTSVRLTFSANFDWAPAAEAFGGQDCYVAYGGEGDFYTVEDNYLVFAGTWDQLEDDCEEAFGGEVIRSWAGGAFHSFYFTSDASVLLDWYAHRDEGEYSTTGDPVFYVTEMDMLFDPTEQDPSIEWSLVEDLVDPTFPTISLGTMEQTLVVEFTN